LKDQWKDPLRKERNLHNAGRLSFGGYSSSTYHAKITGPRRVQRERAGKSKNLTTESPFSIKFQENEEGSTEKGYWKKK